MNYQNYNDYELIYMVREHDDDSYDTIVPFQVAYAIYLSSNELHRTIIKTLVVMDVI